jgi:hypothetical protein
MKPEELHDRIEKLITEDGDHCSICGAAFPHLSTTYFGKIKGQAVIVGECCRKRIKMRSCYGGSIYIKPIRLRSKEWN